MKNFFCGKFFLAFLMVTLPGSAVANSDSHQHDDGLQEEAPVFIDASGHDPSVIKVDDTFYVFGSHLAAAKTKDFQQWELVASGVNPDNPLFDDVTQELEETLSWAESDTLWAADVVQLEDGKFYMYYNTCRGDSPRSAMGVAVADNVEGPYEDLGIILKSGMTDEESDVDGTPYDEGLYPENYDATKHPNVVDPHTFFDKNGKLWMMYGSYSGGIFILEMDSETGKPLPGQGYGKKLMGGNHSRIEGPYIQYHPETDYYYMYFSFGGLTSDGGYNMRVARSKNPDGPYYDAEGNNMIDVHGKPGTIFDDRSIEPYGVKLMGNHLFERKIGDPGTGIGTGYVSPGHNSVYYDAQTGQQFLIFHSRFPERGETHEIRVHQMFMNKDGWPVVAPYRYGGETLEKVYRKDIVGDYKFIDHGKDISADIKESVTISLDKNNKVSGEVSGKWKRTGYNSAALTVDGVTYHGVFLRQWDPTSESYKMTFCALSKEGVAIWGSKMISNRSDEQIVEDVQEDLNLGDTSNVVDDLTLPTEGTRETEISWSSSNPEVVTDEGIVHRPEASSENATAIITATITKGDITASKNFTITVLPEKEEGLIAHYAFEDNLIDSTGNFDAGTITGDRINNTGGTITYTSGVVGDAALFNGSTGVRLPNGLILGDEYSVSIWLNPEQLTTYTTTFFGARDSSNWVSLVPKGHGDVNNNTMVWSAGSTWYDAATGLQIGTNDWTHLAFTVGNGTITVYVDGEQKFIGTGFPNTFTTTDSLFSLGVNWWDTPYKGLMDELRIYQGAFSEQEIADLAEGSH
ncbi:family 43 glycosylhydrolase [Pseudalkalibacillus sp. A8]|uniref:family 43 glycosylhydrolase n=1 Tax=Pseudalkalibacillus sp. A8 TaxID=3382641 RepID=UPI0038B5A897